jgi:anti-sigma factor RsiW
MRRRMSSEHANDEVLLAYLDGEVSRARAWPIRNHLKTCWKCRSVLADLEVQAQMIARVLMTQLDSDIDRSVKAKETFLRWRTSFERQQKSYFNARRSLLGDLLRVALAQ